MMYCPFLDTSGAHTASAEEAVVIPHLTDTHGEKRHDAHKGPEHNTLVRGLCCFTVDALTYTERDLLLLDAVQRLR